MTKRDKIAYALFSAIYGDLPDDPTFPQRNWNSMTEQMRSLWYHQADVSIGAGS